MIQQKGRPVPLHLQPAVEKEIKKLTKQKHIGNAKNRDENCFVSPAVITVKKNKSVKIALDSRKMNEITVKRKTQIPNMEELLSRVFKKIVDGPAGDQILKLCERTTTDLEKSSGPVHFRGHRRKFCRVLSIFKRKLRLAEVPTIFQEQIDQTLENKHPVSLDDIMWLQKAQSKIMRTNR